MNSKQLAAAAVVALALAVTVGMVAETAAAPPAHAPAHGWRAKHQYRYYPGESCYYDPGRRLWFYIDYGGWRVGASIPTDLKARLGDYVTIGLDTDTPYDLYDEHYREYPPAKYKKKKK
jgi:hypothetical protein